MGGNNHASSNPGPIAGAVVGGLMSDGGEQQTATRTLERRCAVVAPAASSKARTSRRTTSKTLEQPPAGRLPEHVFRHRPVPQLHGPGLMDFANRLMGQNYSRGRHAAHWQHAADQAPGDEWPGRGSLVGDSGACSLSRPAGAMAFSFQGAEPLQRRLEACGNQAANTANDRTSHSGRAGPHDSAKTNTAAARDGGFA